MVAKSYQSLRILTDPYIIKNRKYVKVLTNAGTEKQVRWYDEEEYRKMYATNAAPERKQTQTQKEVLGFGDGYITIFKGDTYPLKDWFKENGARYTKFWGWSFGTFAAVPDEIPLGLTALQLDWDLVGNPDGTLKPETVIQAAVDDLVYDDSPSEYVGEIGDKLELELFIRQTISLDGYYGPSTMHIMEDADENVFVWTTTAKTLTEGARYKVKGTVKDHRVYKHVKQTILTRCRTEAL